MPNESPETTTISSNDIESKPKTSNLKWALVILALLALVGSIVGGFIWLAKFLKNRDLTACNDLSPEQLTYCSKTELQNKISVYCVPHNSTTGGNIIKCKNSCEEYYMQEKQNREGIPKDSSGNYEQTSCEFFHKHDLPCGLIQSTCLCQPAAAKCSYVQLSNSVMSANSTSKSGCYGTNNNANDCLELCLTLRNEAQPSGITIGPCDSYSSSYVNNMCNLTEYCQCGFNFDDDGNEPYYNCKSAQEWNVGKGDGLSGLLACETSETLTLTQLNKCRLMCKELFKSDDLTLCNVPSSIYSYCNNNFPPCICPIELDFKDTVCTAEQLVYLTDFHECGEDV
jgi:hypothetical protein